ncbi:hypothetical protein EVU96_09315 [Bacillus infantis]|uniref:hypothetical protein n=1 Tax=Bacillus infantis TaxID=324767 RepID=UPI00101D0AD6|nr:hypothetical protein [Bacillus infantis]RYI30604.1 hypothetical protein EVU96_09315 [Bacillus infantis]
MLRNVIESPKVVEIYTVSEDVKRGQLVSKNLATKTAGKANDEGVQVHIVDFDAQTSGDLSDVYVSQYDASMDTVKANSQAVLVTYGVGGQFATDQTTGTFTDGKYAVAADGLFSPAAAGKVSKFKYVGEYLDGDKVLKQFQVVDPVTVA